MCKGMSVELLIPFLFFNIQDPGWLSGTVLGYGLDDWGFES
jgi:hypothetical protein